MPNLVPAALVLALAVGIVFFVTRDATPPPPAFAEYPAGDARKQAFIDYFVPIIAAENAAVLEWRERVSAWRDSGGPGQWQRSAFDNLTTNYFMENFNRKAPEDWDALLERLDAVPVSLALAQAAQESDWGTSRFATEANNYFGERCFGAGCGIASEHVTQGPSYEMARFDNPAESVRSYLRNLNRHRAYKDFRALRAQARERGEVPSGLVLADGLTQYSERGDAYVEDLRSIIRANGLQKYDAGPGSQ